MATAWTNPTTIIQYAEEGAETHHISWDDTDDFASMKSRNGQSVGRMGQLEHIARSPKHDITNKTYFIRATGYNFKNLPSVVSGIELKVTARREGRVTDDTIQLCLNQEVIGDNRADLKINPIKVYGGETDLWGVDNITLSTLQDSSFGVVLRFKSHPSWPHRSAAFIDSVEIRIH
jgi:hypothetical protein